MTDPVQSDAPVVVIGAGPVGLAAAAHLAQRGIPFVLFEAGASVAAHVAGYAHVRLFSSWRYNINRAARELLALEGWTSPPDDVLPTAGELVARYLEPLAQTAALRPHIRFGARVVGISRSGIDKAKTVGRSEADFVVLVETADGMVEQHARAVIDASGTWGQPNPIGAHGLPAQGALQASDHISYGMPDILGAERHRFAGRKVLVAGAGHSAAGNLLALVTLAEDEPRTRVVWAVRGTDLRRLFGGGDRDGLPARGALVQRLQALVQQDRLELHTGFSIHSLQVQGRGVTARALDTRKRAIEGIDELVVATGSRPDLAIVRELRTRFDPWLESTAALAPLIDPNVHSCGTVRPHGHRELSHPDEPHFYAIGAKSYGRAPNFLMATGYEQARSVVAALAGDMGAADEVQLELPETGVCSVDLVAPGAAPDAPSTKQACCGGPARANAQACCALDEEVRTQGGAGCGCGTRPSVGKASPAPNACCV
ncbi:MAG: NAD(P)-binding domain-containing protein [Gammaproteobacteria bacterium]|nr:NAD(P)-binding domain-containing protein [Gammaproteobacteria bacterium]MBU1504976.1 NAD(P)-binding domain-containing protein [Gammaproteobacteria bacterium]MBU2122175.1 NAD(P)-binding domain-containing protein [Gammaproteobacteria bacterium]MBU2172201.1 NAD(P)-binding domain-containing protein [Gammaproteobacteria bacterium]MBU2198724.1 NAD(P)-binding domain-containing protein [Gammaproteobacteria bacterium]